ncbi:MAG: zinc ribbon domain-containing protein [Candidatus Hermodarchaeota archaeon]
MKFSTQLDKLQKKIEKEKEHKENPNDDRSGGYLFIDPKKKKPNEYGIKEKLDFLKHLSSMINEGATGFELAYEVEKNQEFKRLIYDGILFYNTFLNIGNKKFIDIPDKIIKNYKSFKTVEDTEKYIFIIWLNDAISSLQEEFHRTEDYKKFIEAKMAEERNEAKKKLREQMVHCKNCGAKIRDNEQEFCEECGENLMKQIS